MKKIGSWFVAALLMYACASVFGQSNPIEGGTTETVTNLWNVPLPWLIVGGNSDSNALIVSDGGQVNNAIGYIGNAVTSTDNSALVTGDGSLWNNTLEFSVGYQGASNSLTVAGGGTVTTPNAYIGNNSDGNTVIVTGSNSLLDATILDVGYQGDENSLMVTDGGTVESDTGTIGYWIGSDGNTAVVQSNGVWDTDELNVGEYGSGNQLVVGAGGLVESPDVNVGVQSISSNNTVTVTGDDAWLDAPELYIGGSAAGVGGIGNLVEVENGGTVATESLNIYDGSAFDLNDGGRLFVNTNFNASMDNFNWNAGGTLEVGGELTGMTNSIEDQRTLVLNGSSAQWDRASSDIKVGELTGSNALSIVNGGAGYNENGYIGYSVGADSNSALVTGSGSVWQNYDGLYLGGRYEGTNWVAGGTGNSLTVEDGGWVLVGDVDTSSLVDHIGSQFGVIAVGDASDAVELIFANGGHVQSDFGFIGFQSDSSSVLVTGSGSVWNNSAGLVIGYNGGSGNSLTIEGGGRVETDVAAIGFQSDNNSALVTGNGSVWNSSEIFVGLTGANNNRLTVDNGGRVETSSGGIGDWSDNNSALVTGTGSVWTNSGDFVVGREGSYNTLNIADNGAVCNDNGYIGYSAGADSNSVLVTGSGSVWQNYERLSLGQRYWIDSNGGTGNSLTVEDGGRVMVGDIEVDALAGMGGGIAVGSMSADVQMSVASGSLVNTENTWIGFGSNHVAFLRVAGSNTVWRSSGDFYVGYQGTGNYLSLIESPLVEVGENLYNRNASTVYLDPGSQVSVGGDYYQDASSLLRFGVETNTAGAPINALITVSGTAEFEENAQIEYASNVGELLFDRFYTNKLIEADALVVAGISNPDSLDLERLDASGSLVDVIFWEHDQDIYALAGRKYLADSAGFAEGSMMARLSKEIDDMSLLGNSEALNMIYLLNTMSGSVQNEQLVQEYAYSTPSYLHIQGMTEGLGELTKHTSRRPAATPEGAAGPYSVDRGGRGWIKPYGNWSDRSDHDGFSGYDHNVYGTLVGMDWIQDNVLFGIAGGYARSDIDQDDGGDSKADTGYGVFFASVGTKDWFGDINVAFGRSDIEDDPETVFGAQSDYKANNFALYMGGGKEMRSRSGIFSFTPKASLLLSEYDQESYTEKMVTGVAREVEAYDRGSIVSSLGAAVAMQQEYDNMILRPEVRVRWLHEFKDDEEKLDFTLSEGMGGQYFSLMPGAEEDILEVGAGLSCGFDNAMSLALDLDWRFGEDYDAYSVSGRAVYEF